MKPVIAATILVAISVAIPRVISAQQPNQPVKLGPSADTIRPYRAAGRDPFKKVIIKTRDRRQPRPLGFPPLEARRAEFQQKIDRARGSGQPEPDPLSQYLVSELEVLGVFRDERGPGAFLRAQPTGTTFFVRIASRCYNGEVVRIETDENLSGAKVFFREVTYIDTGTKQVPQERVVAKATIVPGK
jgi:hypothetical protein